MKRWILFAVLPLAGSVACGPTEEPPAPVTHKPPPPAVSTTPIRALVTDAEALRATAHRLAGLPLGDESDAEAVWSHHAGLMDAAWKQLEERHLSAMRSWAQAELAVESAEAPLFYPFSGPDLPNALQFFPRASTYVLVGLERPGRIPDLEQLDAAALDPELERLRGGLENLIEAGYFVTKKMETDFVAPHLEGVLPLLYLFLARAGMTPTAVQFVTLDAEGAIVPLESVNEDQAVAVRLEFGGEEGPRSLVYFSQDLSNAGLADNPAFGRFLERLGPYNMYTKSASYLLHMDGFTDLKGMLLSQAGAVLQDDSGIPLRDLSAESWQRDFFGTYTRTLPTYREWFQEELKQVYESADVPPLPFAIGYNSRIGGSCLIWARRR